jgi:S-adenosylmethionine hydrolase
VARPIIALLTDFGLRDHYVAAMKGVVLGIAPDATLVDITHDIPPQDILSAALELVACYGTFPADTVFLVVVDPGVGTARRPIAARAGDYSFVAPDNGVLAPVFDRQQAEPLVVELRERRYARPEISRTFEGRDRFAPAAAWLARGTDIRALGPVVTDAAPLPVPRPRRREDGIAGEIVKVDRFGNLISNVDRRLLDLVAHAAGPGTAAPIVRVGGHAVGALVSTYGEVQPGGLCALVGSAGYLEVAANGDSAARLLGVGRGAPVTIEVDAQAMSQVGDLLR